MNRFLCGDRAAYARIAVALMISLLAVIGGCGDGILNPSTDIGAEVSDVGKQCQGTKSPCGELCVELQADPVNCGACGNPCGKGEVCSNGKCALYCAEPLVDCGGICADLNKDGAHCGKCSDSCQAGEACNQGKCEPNCQDGYTNCGGKCVSLQGDSLNCKVCGQACEAGQLCVDGVCTLTCQKGLSQCDGVCVNTLADEKNCGGCKQACDPGQVCSNGECAISCQVGLSECASACVDNTSSLEHCGGCNQPCAPGEKCSAGKCALTCQSGLTACVGTCINFKTDPLHCGGCEKPCNKGEICQEGGCQLACPGTQTACDGACADTETSDQHCGGCNQPCEPGKKCTGGVCTLTCLDGYKVCGGACINPKNDIAHCGECGNTCKQGTVCSGGKCVASCPVGFLVCSDVCVNPKSDNLNCGDCDSPCPPGHVCSDGMCMMTCQPGLTPCSGKCTNFQTDPKNCGDCGFPCGAGEACNNGKCESSCKPPLMNCGGQCIDASFDPGNCGGCDLVCKVANGSPACVGGNCEVVNCIGGYANCDGKAANGCEVHLPEDGTNCGACNKTCNLFHAVPTCQGGTCKVVTCDAGWGNCNGKEDDGCETNLLVDQANCGECNKPVADGEACCGGKAIAAVTYATDPDNCGGCGIACKQGQTCCGGFCYTQDASKICPECGKVCNVAEVSGNKFITTGNVSRLEASGSGISTVSNEGGKNQLVTPKVWIATHDSNLVNRLDTGSGKLMSVFPSFGTNPSRGAVALDDTFWIGNRCPSDPDNPKCSNVAQLKNDGTQGCLVGTAADGKPLPFVRALAGDGNGYIWVGTWNDNRIHKIDPLKCKTVADFNLPSGANPYGFAVDRNGLLWISSPADPGSPLRSFDTNTGKIVDAIARPYNTYGVVIDGDNNAWFAAWCTNHLLRIDATSKKLNNMDLTGFDGNWCARGVAVDIDGNVWAAVSSWNSNSCGNASYVAKYQKTTGKHLGNYKMPAEFGGGALGISMDAAGRIWVTSTCTDKVARVNKDSGVVELVAPLYGTNPYTYSDWTGAMLKNVTTHNGQVGVWTANFDGLQNSAQWQQASYDSITPAGTAVRLRFRAANAIEAIEGAPWCVPEAKSPIDLKSCNFGPKRWLQVEVYLITNDVDVQSTVDNFKVYWQK